MFSLAGIVWVDSFITKVLDGFSSIIDEDLCDTSLGFLIIIAALLALSFLITDCICFFFILFVDCSSLAFLLTKLAVGTGEIGLFCCGEWRLIGSCDNTWSSSISLSSVSVLFDVIGPLSTIFYI